MFWLGSDGSPMTVYRTTSLGIQGQRQVTAGVTRQRGPQDYSKDSFERKKNNFGLGLFGGDQP
jgi:hypothetical protein